MNVLKAAGFQARRLAEGGAYDEGDVEANLYGFDVIIESKACQSLNVQAILGKARRKAGGKPVIVWWKRLVRVEGKQLRQPVAGEREVVVLSPSDLLALLAAAHTAGTLEAATRQADSQECTSTPIVDVEDTSLPPQERE